jgi:hypothetical protein
MKISTFVLVVCSAAMLAAAPARAFDIQGEKADLQDGSGGSQSSAVPFSAPVDAFGNPDFSRGSSLALPYSGKSDSGGFVSDYGNMITIPGPGIDRPVPIWAYR